MCSHVPADAELSSRRQQVLVLLCTSIPSFMLQLDANIVSVSLPAIARSLHANFAGIEWVVTAYMLSFASLLMPAGALADRYGRKTLLIVGLATFTFASFLCGAAWNLQTLVAARALQGVGAAMQLSAALATLSHSFQGEARARAFAFWGTVVGLGAAVGPMIGGIITQFFGWEWAFYVNLPIGAMLTILIVRTIKSSRDPHALRLDVLGVCTFSSALFLVTLALIEGNHRGWSDQWILVELGCSALLFVLFIVVERGQARPMLDLSYFRKKTFLGANLAQFALASGVLSMLTFVPIFLQNGLNQTSAMAGILMLPMVVPLFIVPRVVAKYFTHRFSGRALVSTALLFVSIGLLWFAVEVGSLTYVSMIGGMVLVGIGAGILNGEATKVGMAVVPKERSGMASGLSGTLRFTGLVIGIAALGVVLYSRVEGAVSRAIPSARLIDRLHLTQEIAAGHMASVSIAGVDDALIHSLSLASFAYGYQGVFITGSAFLFASSLLTWILIDPHETAPVSDINRGGAR